MQVITVDKEKKQRKIDEKVSDSHRSAYCIITT